MIKIRAKRDGFRRAGIAHSKKGKIFPDDAFDKDQMAQLESDPMITVEHLPNATAPDTEEAAQARKVLSKMTNDRLKSDCDSMGIEYPATATKAELVDLILTNTAPEPGA